MFCAISGEAPSEPVVSIKSGRVYDRRLIVPYLKKHGCEPDSGEALEESDLVALKCGGRGAAPRSHSDASVPALLTSLQNEWDAVMLETADLRAENLQLQQELSTALYKVDAAERVLARVLKERDAARESLAQMDAAAAYAQNQLDAAAAAPAANAEPADPPSKDRGASRRSRRH